jgi:4a-hydroxytetrahydrobiopterin dehydratase
MALLDDDAISAALEGLEGWAREGEKITKQFECGDFVGSVRFIDAIVEPAEGMNHHPDLEISWSTVAVSITNHAAGGLTEADFELAAKIDALRS